MLITNQDVFHRVFYCRFDDYKVTIIDNDMWEALPEKKKEKYKRYEVTFVPLTWGAHSKLRGDHYYTDPETNMRAFNYDAYNLSKLTRVIKRWNLTIRKPDGQETPVEPTEEMIKRLHPLVADHMLHLYESEVELSGEAEKN